MKKLFIMAAVGATLCLTATSCGNGDKADVNNDSIIPAALVDSVSRNYGAFVGADIRREIVNVKNVDEFIEGFQLAAAQDYSADKLQGIYYGVQAGSVLKQMQQQGLQIDRHTFMQQFRNYLQKEDLSTEEYTALYKELQKVMQSVEAVMAKRQKMRQADLEEQFKEAAVQVEVEEIAGTATDGDDVEESVENVEISTGTPNEEEVVQAPL